MGGAGGLREGGGGWGVGVWAGGGCGGGGGLWGEGKSTRGVCGRWGGASAASDVEKDGQWEQREEHTSDVT